MNTTMADGASERLDAQVADALFGQPGMSKLDVANRLRELRGENGPLLVDAGNPVSPSPATQAVGLGQQQDAARYRLLRSKLATSDLSIILSREGSEFDAADYVDREIDKVMRNG